MSISVYSFAADEAERIKNKDVEIRVNDKQEIEFIKNEDEIPTFNCLYNKEETEQLIDDKLTEIGFGGCNIDDEEETKNYTNSLSAILQEVLHTDSRKMNNVEKQSNDDKFINRIQTYTSMLENYELYTNAIPEINEKHNRLQSFEYLDPEHDRSIYHDSTYVWWVLGRQWHKLEGSWFKENENWRYTEDIVSTGYHLDCNYIWDITNKEWVMLTKTSLYAIRDWQEKFDEPTLKYISNVIKVGITSDEGKLMYNNDKKRWCFNGNPINNAELLENEIVPSYPIDWENILRNYNITTTTNPDKEIDTYKPVYGNYTLSANLYVNGLINGYDFDDFKNFAKKDDLALTYAKKDDVENTYLKKTDAIASGVSSFKSISGYPYYYVKNDDLQGDSFTLEEKKYYALYIDIPVELEDAINKIKGYKNIFKIVLRKNVVYDEEGIYTKEFLIYKDGDKIHSPIIKYDDNLKKCSIMDSNDLTINFNTEYFIAFDEKLKIMPYTSYLNGDISLVYLLEQDSINADVNIKCKLIDAENALQLRQSDIHYFYKPSIITTETIDNVEYYKMIFKIADKNYTIPLQQEFKFIDYCFGNKWTLTWDGSQWEGDNMQGLTRAVFKHGREEIAQSEEGYKGCFLQINNTKKSITSAIPASEKGLMSSLYGMSKREYVFRGYDKSEHLCNEYKIDPIGFHAKNNPEYGGYDYLGFALLFKDLNLDEDIKIVNKINKEIEFFELYLIIPGQETKIKLTFKLHNSANGYGGLKFGKYLQIYPVLNSIETLPYHFQQSLINTNSRDVELYLHKDFVEPIEEVNWDSETNAFDYIIKQQFYEVYPNPNAATTLYTDFNITSSKIITADNITTMRSDVNMLTNTVDVVSYDVRDISGKVAVLNEQMVKTREVMQYMQRDIKTNRIIASTALAFGIIGTVGSIASIGMQLSSSGISFATKNGYQMMGGITSEAQASGYESFTESVALFQSTPLSLRSIATDISPVLDWSNQPYSTIPELPFEEEYDNPRTKATTLHMTIDMCNTFRDTLKPAFKLLATRINEISAELESLGDINNTYTTVDEVNEVLTNYVQKSEFDKLKQENEELKAKIQSLQPKYPWQEFYQGFDERIEFIGYYDVGFEIFYTLNSYENYKAQIDIYLGNEGEVDGNYEYLLLLTSSDFRMHYIRVDLPNNKAYYDEIYKNNISIDIIERVGIFNDLEIRMDNVLVERDYKFTYIFKKSIAA